MTPAEEKAAAERVDAVIADLQAAIEAQDDLRQGFVEVSRLSIGGDAGAKMAAAIAFLEARLQLMRQSLTALESLKVHGYPKVPRQIISGEIQEELQAKLESIQLAYAAMIAGKMKFQPPVTE